MTITEGDPRSRFVIDRTIEKEDGENLADVLCNVPFQECSGVAIQTADLLTQIEILDLASWIQNGIFDYYDSQLPIKEDNLRILLTLLELNVLSEGIKNAVAHGNKYEPNKKVQIMWELNQDITLSIVDEGTEEINLIPEEIITDRDLLEELIAGGGNGVKLIKGAVDILRGQAVWNPLYNDTGQKDGTELRITVPVLQWIL